MELEILNLIQTIHTPFLDKLMVFITSLGNSGMIWILLALVLVLIPRTRKCGCIVAAALVIDLILCNGILKNAVARVRPCDVNDAVTLLIPRPADYSFPSGHTAAGFAAVMALYLGQQKKLFGVSLVLALVIAFSRMYLYVHYPTDILGGIAVGVLAGWLGYLVIKWIERRKKNGNRNYTGISAGS